MSHPIVDGCIHLHDGSRSADSEVKSSSQNQGKQMVCGSIGREDVPSVVTIPIL